MLHFAITSYNTCFIHISYKDTFLMENSEVIAPKTASFACTACTIHRCILSLHSLLGVTHPSSTTRDCTTYVTICLRPVRYTPPPQYYCMYWILKIPRPGWVREMSVDRRKNTETTSGFQKDFLTQHSVLGELKKIAEKTFHNNSKSNGKHHEKTSKTSPTGMKNISRIEKE